MIEYRLLALNDVKQVVSLMEYGHGLSNYSKLMFDFEFAANTIIDSIHDPYCRTCLAIDNNAVVGFCYAAITRIITSSDFITEEKLLWVKEDYRSNGIGENLIRDLFNWSKVIGAKMMIGNSTIGYDLKRSSKFYISQGFELMGNYFVKGVL